MIFYEVLADGYHSPLTKAQIAELFQAGRLARHHRCKQVTARDWRTIDELFPLLKYNVSGVAFDASAEASEPRAGTRQLMLLFMALIGAGAVAWFCLPDAPAARIQPGLVTVQHWPRTIPDETTSLSSVSAPQQVETPSTDQATTHSHDTSNTSLEAQLAEQRRQAEQRAREAAQAESQRDRLMAERAAAARKGKEQDTIIPLDRDSIVNVGGLAVIVRIHDNDVTTFDVWINGARRREVPKQKGITGSSTDETFIYGYGKARLFYVWELSGKLDHCRLRVREE